MKKVLFIVLFIALFIPTILLSQEKDTSRIAEWKVMITELLKQKDATNSLKSYIRIEAQIDLLYYLIEAEEKKSTKR